MHLVHVNLVSGLSKVHGHYNILQICEDDKFSKNICIKCCSTLQTLCEFIEKVRKAQDHLHTLSSATELAESSTTILNAIKEEKTEFTEICIDPMVIYMPDETSTDHYKYPYAEEVVTLKLIGKDQIKSQEKKQPKKNFVCKVCNKIFFLAQALKTHSWSHIHDKKYTCRVCHESFKFQADLKKHFKAHTVLSSNLFVCEICGRR